MQYLEARQSKQFESHFLWKSDVVNCMFVCGFTGIKAIVACKRPTVNNVEISARDK